jgi:N-acetylneuraminate synthase
MRKVFIIAEAGSVHDGSFGNAQKLIELATSCGADAVKFQTHLASAETLRNAPMPQYFKGEPRYEYFERTGFSIAQWKQLAAFAKTNNIEFLSSPFSVEAVALLEEVGIGKYKIPSGEVSNIPLLEAVAETGKPVLLSSGMSNWEELDRAVATIRRRHDRLCVMQCTSAYPCHPERVGLNVLAEIRDRWQVEAGYSDHTLENFACFAAVSLGATVIEKHMTFSRRMYGSDAPHSAEPSQFMELVRGVREISAILEHPVIKDDIGSYSEMKRIFEKSVVSLCRIPAGATITAEMISVKKPGDGIPAARFQEVIGSVAKVDIAPDMTIPDDSIQWRS